MDLLNSNTILVTSKKMSPFFGKDYTQISLYNVYPSHHSKSVKEYKIYGKHSVGITPSEDLVMCDLTNGHLSIYPLETPACQTKLFFKNVTLPGSLAKNQEFPPHIVELILNYAGLFSTQPKKLSIA